MRTGRVIAFLLAFFITAAVGQAGEFPYRKDYPNVPVIELADVKAGYDNDSILMVDVRSDIEFATIRPKKSYHVSISNQHFIDNLKALMAANPGKKVAAYCNGITCLKSYHAAEKAIEAELTGVYAFDAGIPAWAKAYPAETLLIGKELIEPDKQLISKEQFLQHCVDYETFKTMAAEPNAVAIDARDPMQRTQILPGFEKALPIPLDKLIPNVISKGIMKDKKLLIFDQVGKQVDWLQYYLVENGYTDYVFLLGGATSVLKEQKYR